MWEDNSTRIRNISKAFYFFPGYRRKIGTVEKTINIINERFNEIEEPKEFQIKIKEQVVQKLENKEWDFDEYIAFQKGIRKLDDTKLNYAISTILKLLNRDKEDAKELLKMIAESTKEQPFPLYHIKENNKDIKWTDVFELVDVIIARMQSLTISDANSLLTQYKDASLLINELKRLQNGTKEEKKLITRRFDITFSYLVNVPAFHELFWKYRESYFEALTTSILYLDNAKARIKQTDCFYR